MRIDRDILAFLGLIVVLYVIVFGILAMNELNNDIEDSCNACLERNEIPCEYGHCSEQLQDVEDCCPECWVTVE